MFSLQWPYVFLLLPLPLLMRWWLPNIDSSSGAVRVPFYKAIKSLDQEQAVNRNSKWLYALLLGLIWILLLAATARPTWVGEPVTLPQERRDLLLAVDISRSMLDQDMIVNKRRVDRLSVVKKVVGEFVEERQGDRLGLILFGDQSYLQTPLTFDSQTVDKQLQEAQVGFAGNATAIGDTIGLAIKRLRDRPADSRVLILLTDGANSAGTEPAQAADIAAEANIRIHTVGVGADVQYSRDIFGRTRQTKATTDLDEASLKSIANKTGGQYFRARDPKELQSIYAQLDQLEPIADEQNFRPSRSLLHWPLLLALLLNALLVLLMRRLAG